jgi:hypothetical protein
MRTFSLREQHVYGFWAAVASLMLLMFGMAEAYEKAKPSVEAKLVERSTVGQRTLVLDPLAPATIGPSPRE